MASLSLTRKTGLTKVKQLTTDIEKYYTQKIKSYGKTAKGVDWNGHESQTKRFQKLYEKVFGNHRISSIGDLGCGYGALAEFVQSTDPTPRKYYGYDISHEMISRCAQHPSRIFKHIVDSSQVDHLDYYILSGVFNVKLNCDKEKWEQYIFETLKNIDHYSSQGFAFNMLTSYSDSEKMRDNLYYASPEKVFQFCMKNFSNQVCLSHDYGLYEFTVYVSKA